MFPVVTKKDALIIPDDGYVLKEGEVVIGVVKMKNLQKIKRILEIQ